MQGGALCKPEKVSLSRIQEGVTREGGELPVPSPLSFLGLSLAEGARK